jgi:hypothetical protein
VRINSLFIFHGLSLTNPAPAAYREISLQAGTWLDEAAVHYALLHALRDRQDVQLYTVAHLDSNKLAPATAKLALFPIVDQRHWVLFIGVRGQSDRMYKLCSLSFPRDRRVRLGPKMKGISVLLTGEAGARVKTVRVPQQENNHDCGVYLINNVIEILGNPETSLKGFAEYSNKRDRSDIKTMVAGYIEIRKKQRQAKKKHKREAGGPRSEIQYLS